MYACKPDRAHAFDVARRRPEAQPVQDVHDRRGRRALAGHARLRCSAIPLITAMAQNASDGDDRNRVDLAHERPLQTVAHLHNVRFEAVAFSDAVCPG